MIPRHAPLLVTTLLLVPALLADAAPAPQWHPADCGNAELLKAYPLPQGLTREGVLRDLLGGPLVKTAIEREAVCTVFGARWKAQKVPTLLVFVESAYDEKRDNSPTGFIDTVHKLRLGMYRQDPGGRYQLVAKSTDGSAYEFEDQEKVSALDLAPYKLTPTEYGFGVRMYRNFTYGGGGGTEEALALFRVEEDGLRMVLYTLMASESMIAQSYNKDGTVDHEFNGDQRRASISVSKQLTDGFFDLIKRKGRRSAVFKWNGEGYELRGRDPVKDENG